MSLAKYQAPAGRRQNRKLLKKQTSNKKSSNTKHQKLLSLAKSIPSTVYQNIQSGHCY